MPALADLSNDRIMNLYIRAVERDAKLIKELQLENQRLKGELDRLHRKVAYQCADARCPWCDGPRDSTS